MKLVRITLTMILSALVITGFSASAHAYQGDSASDPYVVTDPRQVPEGADLLVVDGCKTVYSWSVYTPGALHEDGHTYTPEKTEYYSYVDARFCDQLIHPKITVVDRCGWTGDAVKVKFNKRLESVTVRQVTKTKWRVKMIARDGYFIVKPGREFNTRSASFAYHLEASPCKA